MLSGMADLLLQALVCTSRQINPQRLHAAGPAAGNSLVRQAHSWQSLFAGPGIGVRAQPHRCCAHAMTSRQAREAMPSPPCLGLASRGGFQASTQQALL